MKPLSYHLKRKSPQRQRGRPGEATRGQGAYRPMSGQALGTEPKESTWPENDRTRGGYTMGQPKKNY